MSILSVPATPSPPDPPPVGPLSVAEFLVRYKNERVELVRGFVKEMPVPMADHGKVGATVVGWLFLYNHQHDLGHIISHDSWLELRDQEVRGADVMFISYGRLPRGRIPEGVLQTIPELVVEVRSPSDLWTEMFAKADEYLAAGVSVVVILDPGSATASVHRPGASQTVFDAADTLTLDDVLPGFSVPVARLFA